MQHLLALLSASTAIAVMMKDYCPTTKGELDCMCPDGYRMRSPCVPLPDPGAPMCPSGCVDAPPMIPPYAVVTDGTCVSNGMIDILEVDMCRNVLNDGYYNTRDQNGNGVLDYKEDYPIPVVDGAPPGCWPVEPGTPGFDTFPLACITPLETAVGNCSTNFPCFCKLPEYVIVKSGTCTSNGYYDILEEPLCRAVMNDGYYSTRDQDGNGVIDSNQQYPIPVALNPAFPPGCWPVEPGTPGFAADMFPFACITPQDVATGDCSDNFPCFCLP